MPLKRNRADSCGFSAAAVVDSACRRGVGRANVRQRSGGLSGSGGVWGWNSGWSEKWLRTGGTEWPFLWSIHKLQD